MLHICISCNSIVYEIIQLLFLLMQAQGVTDDYTKKIRNDLVSRVSKDTGANFVKGTFFLAVLTEGIPLASDLWNLFTHILYLQEAYSKNDEKQVKHVQNELQEILASICSRFGSVGGATVGALIGSAFPPGMGQYIGGVLGSKAGHKAGGEFCKIIGKAVFT